MNLYEMHVSAFKGEDTGMTGDFYFTSLSKAINHLQTQIEPDAVLIELYSAKIDKITPVSNLRLPQLLCNVANQTAWINDRSTVKEFEYDYNTGERTNKL